MRIKEYITKYQKLITIMIINFFIFVITNILFDIKYEQVDDFIIYNLYSGLDGTYNMHGIYIHPIICCIISMFYRILPSVNWHTIFLLSMQFICFTTIGYLITKKFDNSKIAIVVYSICAAVFYTSLLMLIQYTSVAALLILTSFFIIIYLMDNNVKKNKMKYNIMYITLFTIGIMTRMQSLLIILPFFAIYGIYYLVKLLRKNIKFDEFAILLKAYLILALITILVYISTLIIYNTNEEYKEYMEYNNLRSTLHDLSYTYYDENKEIFDEISWSENDHYLFYTFDFGDENVYSKENLQKIIDYKKSKNQYYNLNLNPYEIFRYFVKTTSSFNIYIFSIFITIFLFAILKNKEKRTLNVLIFLTSIGINLLFIVLNRIMPRVVLPEYIIGTILLLYNSKIGHSIKEGKNIIMFIVLIIIIIDVVGNYYKFDYELKDYTNYKTVINYTNENKENVYLYTVPALQYRYLVYSVYEMPPKGSFSNLRVIGGWDMYTGNYNDFKKRYNLEGTFMDFLKENVYLIDGDVYWSGNIYHDYIKHIVLFIKEHYGIDVEYKKIEQFDNIYVYKIIQKGE